MVHSAFSHSFWLRLISIKPEAVPLRCKKPSFGAYSGSYSRFFLQVPSIFFWDVYAPHSAYSNEKATVSFLTGYLLEKSLSVDNLFVFAIIFAQYKVPEHLRPRALLWGVIGALLLRAIMIAVARSCSPNTIGYSTYLRRS